MNGSLLPARLEAVRGPRNADSETLRLCRSEADAIAASVALSGLTYREIAARMGVSKSLVNAMAKGDRTLPTKRTAAFCAATGTNLVRQFRAFEMALRDAQGAVRERDRMQEICAPTLRAWEAAA